MNLAMGPSGEVDSKSSTSLSATGKEGGGHLLLGDGLAAGKGETQDVVVQFLRLVYLGYRNAQMVNLENFHGPPPRELAMVAHPAALPGAPLLAYT